MNEMDAPFGLQVYDEIRRRTSYTLIGQKFEYAAIQTLKAADRQGVASLLLKYGLDCRAWIDTASVDEVVDHMLSEFERIRAESERTSTTLSLVQFITSLLSL